MRVGMQKGSAALVIALIVVLVAIVVWVSLDSDDTSADGPTPESPELAAQPSAVDADQGADGDADVAIEREDVDVLKDFGSGLPTCGYKDLPATSLNVIDDIGGGGPFDYPRNDGGTFGNYEGILPGESNGYYREYTVETPGLNHRGARRIVTGGFDDDNPEEWFFTSDHYNSFCEFAPVP